MAKVGLDAVEVLGRHAVLGQPGPVPGHAWTGVLRPRDDVHLEAQRERAGEAMGAAGETAAGGERNGMGRIEAARGHAGVERAGAAHVVVEARFPGAGLDAAGAALDMAAIDADRIGITPRRQMAEQAPLDRDVEPPLAQERAGIA